MSKNRTKRDAGESKSIQRQDQVVGLDVEIDQSTAIVKRADSRSHEPAGSETIPADAVVRQVQETRPYCSKHNVLMIASSTTPSATLYRCRVPGCTAKGAKLQPRIRAPIEPLMCPQCRVACEVDQSRAKFGGSIYLRMVCPDCQFSLDVPRPDAAQIMNALERRVVANDVMDAVSSSGGM